MKTILLFSDMDRTVIPNGDADESPQARQRFSRLASHPGIDLAYVTGRDRQLVESAIDQYDLPAPVAAICDVGATLYHVHGGVWEPDRRWETQIGHEWKGYAHDDVTRLLADIHPKQFYLQPPEKQSRFKISYFADISLDIDRLRKQVAGMLDQKGIPANIICSVDTAENVHLLDILPPRANKLLAIQFLIRQQGLDENQVVFSGDSGNDLDVLTSGMQAILVGNAADDIRQTAIEQLTRKAQSERLYLAKGQFKGMNGNYAAGVLEGMAHFFPETASWF